jgi:hypothetical protein
MGERRRIAAGTGLLRAEMVDLGDQGRVGGEIRGGAPLIGFEIFDLPRQHITAHAGLRVDQRQAHGLQVAIGEARAVEIHLVAGGDKEPDDGGDRHEGDQDDHRTCHETTRTRIEATLLTPW